MDEMAIAIKCKYKFAYIKTIKSFRKTSTATSLKF
jgi:hypothetical protein